MIKKLLALFKGKETKEPKEYKGFSDFFLHAPESEKRKVISEAVRKSNEDQLRTFKEAELKVRGN